MNGTLPINTLADLIRFKLYEAVVLHDQFSVGVDYLEEAFEGSVKASFIYATIRQIQTSKHLSLESEQDGGGISLTPMGIRAVEKLLKDPASVPSRYRDEGLSAFDEELIVVAGIPASDRTVGIDHNSAEFAEAKETIAAAKVALSSDNAVGQALGDDREIALAEIEQIEQMIDQPRTRASLLKSYSKRSLGWIGEKSAGTVLAELVKKLLEIIMGWLA